MKIRMNRFLTPAFALTLSASGAAVFAQDAPQNNIQEKKIEKHVIVTGDGQTFNVRTAEPGGHTVSINGAGPQVMSLRTGAGQDVKTFSFVASEVGASDRVVKGMPYSAEVVNEFVQTLPNGNRIVRRSSSNVYRDGQGRTRREQTITPLAVAGGGGDFAASKTTIITDPVDGSLYILDDTTKTARRLKIGQPGQFKFVGNGSISSFNSTGKFVVTEDNATTSTLHQTEEIRKINVSGGVLQGSALNRVQPVYPSEAKAARVAGTVIVQVNINETGEVTSAEAISGHPMLRDAAVTAARQWKFKPTELQGKAVKVQGSLTFNFTLADEPVANANAITLTASSTTTATGVEPAMGMPLTRVGFPISDQGKATPLGKQTIEGIECEGTRIVETIPAGQIGNEQPIEIVIERWVSAELGLTVLSKHNNPLQGETTVKMTNLSRSEPDEFLFKVPSDYTLKEGPAVNIRTTKPE